MKRPADLGIYGDSAREQAQGAALEAKLAEAFGRVLDRMGTKPETLDEAIEAVAPDYGGRDFADTLKLYAQGREGRAE